MTLGKNEDTEKCVATDHRLTEYARRFTLRHWSFLGLGSEKKWHKTHASKLDGECDKTTWDMTLNFSERGHPIFSATNALDNCKQTERNEIHSLQLE